MRRARTRSTSAWTKARRARAASWRGGTSRRGRRGCERGAASGDGSCGGGARGQSISSSLFLAGGGVRREGNAREQHCRKVVVDGRVEAAQPDGRAGLTQPVEDDLLAADNLEEDCERGSGQTVSAMGGSAKRRTKGGARSPWKGAHHFGSTLANSNVGAKARIMPCTLFSRLIRSRCTLARASAGGAGAHRRGRRG